MTLYLDTSVLVAAMTNEKETDRMQAWLASLPAGALSISDWVMTEFSAALSIKVRSGALRTEHQRAALAEMTHMGTHNYTVPPIERTTFQAAARLADEVGHGLRVGATPCTSLPQLRPAPGSARSIAASPKPAMASASPPISSDDRPLPAAHVIR